MLTVGSRSSGITEELCRTVTGFTYDDLPAEVVQVARAAVLDGIGNMLAGSHEPIGDVLREFLHQVDGRAEATVVGSERKASAPYAAFVNAAFGHCLDYEIMWVPPTHPNSPVLPSLLALAERDGRSGRDLIVPLVAAFEVQGRLNLAIQGSEKNGMRFHPPSTLGIIGSAVGCGLLLGFDVATLQTAIGIAADRAGGLLANTGTMTKSQHSAHAARTGVESALMARAGYTASRDILEVPSGFAEALFGPGVDLDLLLKDFGAPFRMVDPGVVMKFYPAQFTTHWTIEAALAIAGSPGFDAAEVRRVIARVGNPNWSADRPPPVSGLDGKFSIPYTVAVALLDGRVTIDSFTDSRRFSPDIERLLGLITVIQDHGIPPGLDFVRTWAEVTVELQDGRLLVEQCLAPRGRWDRPLTRSERLQKFYGCALRAIPEADADRIVELVDSMEELADLNELMSLVGGIGSR